MVREMNDEMGSKYDTIIGLNLFIKNIFKVYELRKMQISSKNLKDKFIFYALSQTIF